MRFFGLTNYIDSFVWRSEETTILTELNIFPASSCNKLLCRHIYEWIILNQIFTRLSPFQQELEQQDVYCFGHVLYEMTFGKELRAPTTDEIPPNCPPLLGIVLINYAECLILQPI